MLLENTRKKAKVVDVSFQGCFNINFLGDDRPAAQKHVTLRLEPGVRRAIIFEQYDVQLKGGFNKATLTVS
jgi:hypothetical protein